MTEIPHNPMPGDFSDNDPLPYAEGDDDASAIRDTADDVGADTDMLNSERDSADGEDDYDYSNDPAPLRFKEVHLINGVLVEDEHPDPGVRDAVLAEKTVQSLIDSQVRIFAEEVPTLNDRYPEEIAAIHAKLAADFGLAPGDAPILLLDKSYYEVATSFAGHEGDALGMYVSGHVIVSADDELVTAYGPQYIRRVGYHEAGHAAVSDQQFTLATRPAVAGDKNIIHGTTGDYVLIGDFSGGYGELDMQATGRGMQRGDFWTEGIVDSNSIRGMVADGLAAEVLDVEEAVPLTGTRRVHLTGLESRAVVARDGQPNLPWKYATGVQMHDGSVGGITFSSPAMAAYAIDRLDREVPGLFDTMRRGLQDESLRPVVRAMVDSIRPGLYDEQARQPYSPAGFHRGLMNVIEALGIADDWV